MKRQTPILIAVVYIVYLGIREFIKGNSTLESLPLAVLSRCSTPLSIALFVALIVWYVTDRRSKPN